MTAPLERQWWELYVWVPESLSEAASEYLHGLGSTAVVFHEQAVLLPQQTTCIATCPETTTWTVLQGALPLDDALPVQVAALQQWLRSSAGETAAVQLYCRPLLDVDYLTQWQQFFQPLSLEGRLIIRPPWETAPIPAGMACLTLNPGPAFGTGTHPSTHLCLHMLLHYAAPYQGSTLLDVGCGSGILSLAALQLGWQSAVGVDIDAQAIAVATHNAELNGLQDRAHFVHGSWQSVTGVFPCITANIYLGPLVEMLRPLTRYLAPGGTLVLSGLLASQEVIMRTTITSAGLAVQARRVEEGWVTLAVRRASDPERGSTHV
ncbi:MAG TPA: 50S ribosomal protein L11 methyltransferase [Candidatus Tectomicrobia bacterium]